MCKRFPTLPHSPYVGILPDKFVAAQRVEKSLAFYGTGNFITMFQECCMSHNPFQLNPHFHILFR